MRTMAYDERDRKQHCCISAPKGQSEMQVLQDHPSSEEKPNRNLEGLSLESLFIKNPALLL